jgi:hypothetical protein
MNPKQNLTAILFFAAIFLLNFSVKSQSASDTISMVKKGGDYSYSMNNETLSKAQLMRLLNEDKTAIKLMEKSNNRRIVGYCFAVTGGVCIGYAVGCVIVGGANLNTALMVPLLGAGACLVAVGIVFEVGANGKAKEAIAVYNTSKRQNNTTLNLGLCSNGMVVRLSF